TYQRHDAGHAQEEEGEGDEGGQSAARPLGAEKDEFGAGAIDFDGEEPNEADERGQRDRGEAKQIATGVGPQESETDAEKTRQQDEVGEIREVEDIRADPSDESQLEKEHQEAERHQPDLRRFGRGRHWS